jgi:hypothetical protein
MTSRTNAIKAFLLLAATAFSACGNYSNEDLDFELALPQDGDLDAKLPQALTLDNSAEYYKLTRQVVTAFNGGATALTSLVDHVRSYPPTSRNGGERTWGPFADDKHSGWQMRVVMVRSADPSAPAPAFVISYEIDLRNTVQSGSSFFTFMNGQYASSGSARHGQGQMHLAVQTARDAGYPVDDFGDLAQLDLTYNTLSYPITVDMVIANVPTANSPGATYDYTENADGSGQLDFDWMVAAVPGGAGPTNVTFASRWLGSGAGRADAYVPGLAGNTLVGTDCWGPDTLADYEWRWNGQGNSGSADLCVFSTAVF